MHLLKSRLFQRRRQAGLSVFLFFGALLGCVTAALMVGLVAPMSWWRAREVGRLPRPVPSDLASLAPGTEALIAARLPADAETGPYELALFRVERRSTGESEEESETGTWVTMTPLPTQVVLLLEDGMALEVRLPPETDLLDAQKIEMEGESETQRYVGFYPGQALTLEGTWEGEHLVTARSLYAGSPDAYVAYMRAAPGGSVRSGVICGGLSLVLLITGAVLWILGR